MPTKSVTDASLDEPKIEFASTNMTRAQVEISSVVRVSAIGGWIATVALATILTIPSVGIETVEKPLIRSLVFELLAIQLLVQDGRLNQAAATRIDFVIITGQIPSLVTAAARTRLRE